MAAAPFAAATASLADPTAAQAATLSAGQFTLAERTSNSYGGFAGLNSGLSAALPKVSVGDVLADGNRSAVRLASAPSGVTAFAGGFSWDSGDGSVDYWVPQGVTTSADALGAGVYPAGGDRAVLVSWYFDTDPNNDGVVDYPLDKGSRLTFVNYDDASAPVYRHVLLVEPTTSGGAYSYQPVRVHAGGILWYGDMLYLVDTYKGLRAFDLNTILQVSTGQPDLCGVQSDGTTYYAYDYKYVLPQALAYDNTGTLLRYSALALDRASTPDSLTVVEYTAGSTVDYSGSSWNGDGTTIPTPKIVRWNLDYTTRELSSGTASEAVSVQQGHMQGSVAQQSRHYLSISNGSSNGSLRTVTSGADTPSTLTALYRGCEDLSFHSSTASDWAYSESVIWTLSETAGYRRVYAVHADGS